MIQILNKIHKLKKHISIFCQWNIAGIVGFRNFIKELSGKYSHRYLDRTQSHKDAGHLSSVHLLSLSLKLLYLFSVMVNESYDAQILKSI